MYCCKNLWYFWERRGTDGTTYHDEYDGGEVKGSDELPLRARLVRLHLDDGGLQDAVVLVSDGVFLLHVLLHLCGVDRNGGDSRLVSNWRDHRWRIVETPGGAFPLVVA